MSSGSLMTMRRSRMSRGTASPRTRLRWVAAWDDLVQRMWATTGTRLPGFPLWADEWRWSRRSIRDLKHAAHPKWKSDILEKNAQFYDDHREVIDDWFSANKDFRSFPPSRRKLEWQAQNAVSLWDTVMHFRPSGIRAKAPTTCQRSWPSPRRPSGQPASPPHTARGRPPAGPPPFLLIRRPAGLRVVQAGWQRGRGWSGVARVPYSRRAEPKRPSAVVGRECAPSCRKPADRFAVAGRVGCGAGGLVAVSRYAHVGLRPGPDPQGLERRRDHL